MVWLFAILASIFIGSCTNDPYRPEESGKNIYYDTFDEEPKHLDPALAYSRDEYTFIQQIYEPPLQYHYLKRPYELVPLRAVSIPEAKLHDRKGQVLPPDAPEKLIAKVVYAIELRPGTRYQNHPAFALDEKGDYRWHLGPGESFPAIEHPNALPGSGTRELRAEDYAYQIKRLAHPLLESPIFTVMAGYIAGFREFQETLGREIERVRQQRREAAGPFYNQEADERNHPIYLDLRDYDLPGVEVTGPLSFRIILKKPYPQFVYWLAMPFFAPVPWEVDRFYTQSAASEQNITLDRFPVGTGPFTLAVNQPNYRMVLRRNPLFQGEHYPRQGSDEDEELGLLGDRGKPLPFLEEAVFVLEKEGVPRWNKFLQGYYDTSAISSDVFDQAVQFSEGDAALTDALSRQGIRLQTAVAPATRYYAFNMLDDVVGGYDEKRRKLRQALSIALNIEEFSQIFLNGRGVPAQGPIPPGIFGHETGRRGMNPVVYEWDDKAGAPRRKSLDVARRLLAEAGYPGGRDASGRPLVIFFDTTQSGAGSKPYLDWLRKQFAALGVQLQIRSTDYNRFREKVRRGNFQLLQWGWRADYPDPENFLFLLYGPNAKVRSQGENAANYENPEFDSLFRKMENMPNSPRRNAVIQEMLTLLRQDAPWIWGYHPIDYGLYQGWYHNAKPASFGRNTLKYQRVDAAQRELKRAAWNPPVVWPIWLGLGMMVAGTVPAAIVIYRRQRTAPK